MDKSVNKKIVILGGGFGGVRAALDLSRGLPKARIILVDANSYHSFPSDFYEISASLFAARYVGKREEFLKLRSTIAIPFSDIFEKCRNVEFQQGAAMGIDFLKREVLLDSGKVHYDFLILALGSQTNFFAIPYLAERSLELKSAADALNIRSALEELFESRGKHEVISVVIGGGGFTGCELAGELAPSLKKFAKRFSHPVENVSLTLLEGKSRLLSSLAPWFGEKAKKRLEALGVKVKLESFITEVREKEVLLKGKPPLSCDLLIWAAGVRANRLVDALKGVKRMKDSRLAVDGHLHLIHSRNTFVIGDLADTAPLGSTEPLPLLAQVAISQGRYVAEVLGAEVEGRAFAPFRPPVSGFLIPLGGKYALLGFGFVRLSGFLPWCLKRLVALKYFLSILPFFRAFSLWWRGSRIFTQND